MMTSWFLGLKEDIGPNLSAADDHSFISKVKCHINRSLLAEYVYIYRIFKSHLGIKRYCKH